MIVVISGVFQTVQTERYAMKVMTVVLVVVQKEIFCVMAVHTAVLKGHHVKDQDQIHNVCRRRNPLGHPNILTSK
jgi:hypothetical protein